jgi:hypothetical protein
MASEVAVLPRHQSLFIDFSQLAGDLIAAGRATLRRRRIDVKGNLGKFGVDWGSGLCKDPESGAGAAASMEISMSDDEYSAIPDSVRAWTKGSVAHGFDIPVDLADLRLEGLDEVELRFSQSRRRVLILRPVDGLTTARDRWRISGKSRRRIGCLAWLKYWRLTSLQGDFAVMTGEQPSVPDTNGGRRHALLAFEIPAGPEPRS